MIPPIFIKLFLSNTERPRGNFGAVFVFEMATTRAQQNGIVATMASNSIGMARNTVGENEPAAAK